jgi:hypothetical protein
MLSMLGNPRQLAGQLMNFALILSTAFMVRLQATAPQTPQPKGIAEKLARENH